jgi:hypothetical protein
MDTYFSALYDHVHYDYPDADIQVLTPPMAQGNFAETERFVSCVPMTVTDYGESGYDWMGAVFTVKNDGYSWHNYWREGKETWVTFGDHCPNSEHVFQYFPQWLQNSIASSDKPAFITEADLFSPCQENNNPITDKDVQSEQTQESLWQFVSQEQGADYVIAWLLTEYPYSTVAECPTGLTDYEEIRWHQAYENDTERAWFWPWWSRPEYQHKIEKGLKMNKRLSNLQLIAVCALMLGISLGLASCTSQASSVAQPVSPLSIAETDDVALDWSSQSPIPTPRGVTPVPFSDQPTWVIGGQKVWRLLVTPLPDEKVRVGVMSMLPSSRSPESDRHTPRYTIIKDTSPRLGHTEPSNVKVKKLFVQDAQTGQEIRLGDDRGDAIFEKMTQDYVIWRYQWHGRSETVGFKTGLYAYVLKTGKEIIIAQQPERYPLYPKIDGHWVLYTDAENAKKYFANLRVHNLATGEDFLVGNDVPYNQMFDNRPSSDYYAIRDGKIAWVEVHGKWMIRVYDLMTRTERTLNVPDVQSPADFSISGDIVIWWDMFWKGYDLGQDALFTIPTVPPGWENVPAQSYVPMKVRDEQLYWSLTVSDRVYRFTAPILRDE